MTAGAAPLGEAARRLGHAFVRFRFGARRAAHGFRLFPAERLLIAPQELEPGDPSFAVAFYSGHVMLAGRSAQTRGVSVFRIEPPSPAWARQLHGFSWLRHFRDADNVLVRHHARALVGEWLKMRDLRADPVAQLPVVVARRMLSWLGNAPLLLSDAEHGYYHRFMRSLARDAHWLEFSARRRTSEPGRLTAAIAFAAYTLCALTPENDWKRAATLLTAALGDLVMEDGAPISRDPEDALGLAIDLLQLRTAYGARGRTTPPELEAALARLMRFLRIMRHPDGALALFNGMGASPLVLLGAVLAFDDSAPAAFPAAPFGGYHRIEAGEATLIVDCGRAPPAPASEEAHAGALAFEFSAGRERLIVNCGAAPAGLDEMRQALRETAAHSTLVLGGASSARFRDIRAADGAPRRRLADTGGGASFNRAAAEQGERLDMRHDGYARALGLAHCRTLTLARAGDRLEGVDRLEPAGKTADAAGGALLRFHLHPRVAAALSSDAASVRLDLFDGATWTFEAGGAPVRLEESIFFGGLASQRRTVQIVVPLVEPQKPLRWSLSRLS